MVHRARSAFTSLIAPLPLVAVLACSAPASKVTGRLASGGGYLGDWDLYPNHCSSAAGGIILDEAGNPRKRVRIIDRSHGASSSLSKVEIRLDDETPEGPVEVVVTDATCLTGSMEADSHRRSGVIHVDCQTGEGGHVVGTVTYSGCR